MGQMPEGLVRRVRQARVSVGRRDEACTRGRGFRDTTRANVQTWGGFRDTTRAIVSRTRRAINSSH